jgi:uncharacterized protein YndB with AHSA1/START domain
MNATEAPTTIEITRTFDAPPARVYRAWLDPEVLKQWFAPRDWSVTRAEVDERPGGRFGIFQADTDGTELGGMEAEIVELVPNERLVFDWSFVGPGRETAPETATRLTVTLRASGDGTELTLLHERLEGVYQAVPEVVGKVSPGWEMVFDKLERAL